jgi:hypothetical protein
MGEFVPILMLAVIFAGGAIAGAIQWLVLRPLPVSVLWILLTAVGLPPSLIAVGLGFGISVGFLGGETMLGMAAAAGFGGLVFGGMQAPLLARRGWWALAWPVASAAGWAAAVLTFLVVTRGVEGNWATLSTGGALAAGLYGLLTGAALLPLLQHARVIGAGVSPLASGSIAEVQRERESSHG